jgi:hypothetical protein
MAMDLLLDACTYGLHIRYNTLAEGTVSSEEEGGRLDQELQFTMEQIRGILDGLVTEN